MIRRFNYTGRQKIDRQDVPVTVFRLPDNEKTFSIEIGLQEYELPDDALVFVESYVPMKFYQRFAFGSVGKIVPPGSTVLDHIGSLDELSFRVKVVDRSKRQGVLVAIADKIAPSSKQEGEAPRQSLLPVRTRDIGNVVWRLSIGEEDKPVLEISDKIPGLSEIVRTDRGFQALVFPDLVTNVLSHALKEEQVRDPLEDDDMWHLWVRFACNLPGVPPIPIEESDIDEWINEAVDRFGATLGVIEQYSAYLERRND